MKISEIRSAQQMTEITVSFALSAAYKLGVCIDSAIHFSASLPNWSPYLGKVQLL